MLRRQAKEKEGGGGVHRVWMIPSRPQCEHAQLALKVKGVLMAAMMTLLLAFMGGRVRLFLTCTNLSC